MPLTPGTRLGPYEIVATIGAGAGSTFQAGQPKALFRVPSGVRPNWDVAPDGQRFLMLVLAGANSRAPLTVLLNWETLLQK